MISFEFMCQNKETSCELNPNFVDDDKFFDTVVIASILSPLAELVSCCELSISDLLRVSSGAALTDVHSA